MLAKPLAVAGRRTFSSLLNDIPLAPPDKILGLGDMFYKDPNPKKVDLTVGIYKDNNGQVTTFPSVSTAQQRLHDHINLNKNLSYLPITGNLNYKKHVMDFLFKDSCGEIGKDLLKSDRISFAQTLSGTGSLAITARFLSNFITSSICLPEESWANHTNVFINNGFKKLNYYSYYDKTTQTLDIKNWKRDLARFVVKKKLPTGILLHACCHNPTGLDPTKEEWEEIIDTIYELKMIPIIDMAYQGLESGDLIQDAYLIRMLLNSNKYPNWSNGIYLCQSFAKNMGLYGERVGSLNIILPENSSPESKIALESQIKPIIRSMYSSPPGYGSRVATMVLSDPVLKAMWFQDVQNMAARLKKVRMQLFNGLNWKSLIEFDNQHGMFYFTNLNTSQILELRNRFSIYLTMDGRMSLSGINDKNIDYIVESLSKITSNH